MHNKLVHIKCYKVIIFLFFLTFLIFFLIVTSCYILSGSQPFLALYNSGLDTVLLAIIKSETADRVNELIFSLDKEYFKVMIGFFFFMTMIFFLYNSKK